MISVIVPVYNVKPYLRRCLDSIVGQTYKDLEILVIDDGSTDGSSEICDEYKTDKRVRVFHTENRGLSCARNLGIDNAQGGWISFVDSDDWIEPQMMEQVISNIEMADILCYCKMEGIFSGLEALCAHINGKIRAMSWEKLFRKECFSTMRFPAGRLFEDMATTYMLLHNSRTVICKNMDVYHHCKRPGSISTTHNLANIIDYWKTSKERYDYCIALLPELSDNQIKKTYINLLRSLAFSIVRAWGWRDAIDHPESSEWGKMSQCARTMFPYAVRKHFSFRIRGGLFLARYNHPFSFWLAYRLNMVLRMFNGKKIILQMGSPKSERF